MKELAGERGIEAALDARAAAAATLQESPDQTKRRKLRQAEARTRAYLHEMRGDASLS